MIINRNNFYNSNNKKIINKFVKGSIISLCIYFGLTASSPTLFEDENNYSIVEKNEMTEKQMLNILKEEIGIESSNNNLLILYAVLKNDNLDDNEKNLIYKLSTLIVENPYLDIELSYDSLSKLKIEYLGDNSNYKNDTLAIYSYDNNTISVFQEREETNYEILLHELVHSIYTNNKTLKLPKYLIEGETELLTNEYLSIKPFLEKTTYPFEVAMVKILCEMVGEDKVLETYTTGDMNIIKNALVNDGNYLETTRFLDNVEKVFKAFSTDKEIPVRAYNDIIVYMNNYFVKNYQENQEKQETYEYYKGILNIIYKDEPYNEYDNYINENGIIIKPYYSIELKSIYPKTEKVILEEKLKKTLKKAKIY